jgi:hypothetical protein
MNPALWRASMSEPPRYIRPGNQCGPVGASVKFQYVRSASRTFARYACAMAKARVRKPDGRKIKAPDDAIAPDDGSVLPPKKPPAPSAKHRLGRKAKLLK